MSVAKHAMGAAALLMILVGTLPAMAADKTSATSTNKNKKVYQQKIGDAYVSASFQVNRDLGRAWVEVAASPWVDDPQREVIARQMVKGLYYDPERKAVIYQHKGQETVCAEDWKFLLSTSLKSTGNCDLQVNMKDRPLDDGYSVMKEPVTTVTLAAHNLKPSTKTAKGPSGTVEMIVITPDES